MYYISYMDTSKNNVMTRCTEIITEKNQKEIERREHYLVYLYEEALQILEEGDVSYRTEYRRKKNKSYRRIDVPNEQLMKYQKKVVEIFSKKLELLFPQSVYAYVKGRNCKAMAEVHKNQYEIIKLDIKDFFPNCTLKFIMDSMSITYPFCLMDMNVIKTILIPCMIFYDGEYRLPQGAPTSPILSNIAMIPIDYNLGEWMSKEGYIYTRFADDIIISHNENYDCKRKFKTICDKVTFCLEKSNPNFAINYSKTKHLYTKYGNVWMLGVTVGKQVKIGNKKKQKLKAIIWSFLNDCKNGNQWSEEDTRKMLGILGYAKYIEPNFVIELIAKYEQKTSKKFDDEVNKILCS